MALWILHLVLFLATGFMCGWYFSAKQYGWAVIMFCCAFINGYFVALGVV